MQMHNTIEHLLDRFKKNPDAPAQKSADSMSGRPASAAGSYGSIPGYGVAAAYGSQVRAAHLASERQSNAWRPGHISIALLLESASMSDCSTLGLCLAAQVPLSNGNCLMAVVHRSFQLGTAQGYA